MVIQYGYTKQLMGMLMGWDTVSSLILSFHQVSRGYPIPGYFFWFWTIEKLVDGNQFGLIKRKNES